MSTIDKKNSNYREINDHFSSDRNLGKDLKNEGMKSDNDNREIAERGYMVRNGHNPNRPNPDQEDYLSDDDLDDLNDDFHNDRDLEDNNDDIYEVELEEERDELDNPSDAGEDDYDFNETEDVLEDLDEDDDEDEYIEEDIDDDNDYIEDDIQEDNDDDEYPENDPRRL
ncbi:hypothetical protein HNP37_002905 [Flavobacterium nitrogenifigens]|uniref:Uncharacterized protein n=2 Tax=Flavobacterium TaxID=237 RepID=A0A7W7IZK5_9FLAO|nr:MULTISPECIES: hypothetical protein [Flavobacterium]MBB4802830.1 hypothetical protein [Flavobacterium nitrogenifigens]MBB6387788.1 hypothetical protein [Flavobacterium notoginsengisoli]